MTDNEIDSTIPEPDDPWHQLSSVDVLEKISSDVEKGLTDEEAARRLEKYGLNQLDEAPPTTIWEML